MRTLTGMMAVALVLALACGGDDDDDGDSNGACSYDSQCKDDRICVDGQCVPPSPGWMDSGTAGSGGLGGTDGGGVPNLCGNGNCDSGENCRTCPEDCGTCAEETCGDGKCSEAACETCGNCPDDCGECQEATCDCGNGVCESYYCGEDCSSCEDDCGPCSGDGGTDPTETDGPQSGVFRCGNGVCEPGEDEQCGDCLSATRTCMQPCTNNCDCEQPWTACAPGANQVCEPVGCQDCYRQNQYCCWCPADICGNVTCVPNGTPCPSC